MQTASFAGLTFVQTYRYDSLYRITEARETNGPATNGSQNWKETFDYDRFGNRTTFTKFTGTTQLALDNKTFPSIDPATNRFNPNQGYGYDKNGKTRPFSSINRLKSAEEKVGTTTNFEADLRLRPVRKQNVRRRQHDDDIGFKHGHQSFGEHFD